MNNDKSQPRKEDARPVGVVDCNPEHGEKPEIDVVIVNWNTSLQTVATAAAYAASEQVSVRVIVVDNASEVDEIEILRKAEGRDFELVLNRENSGFGSAANIGLSQAKNRYVAISNSDIIPGPDTLAKLTEAIRSRPDAGMAGPVFTDGGNIYHDELPGPFTLVLRSAIGGFGRKRIPLPAEGEIAEVEQPSGACFLLERSTWEEVGGFDDDFFLWYEDVDLARRLIDSGRTNLVVGGATVHHDGGSSFEMVSAPAQQEIRLKSLSHYLHKHHPRTARLASPLFRLVTRTRTHQPGDDTRSRN